MPAKGTNFMRIVPEKKPEVNMPPKKKQKATEEEFEVKHDYIPDFLKALGELADLYEKQGDFRATAMRRAIIALEGQIITGVEDIKLFVLGDLKGVGKGTLGMLEEFIENGTIQRLEDLRPKPAKRFWKLAETDVRKAVAELPEDIKLTVDGEGHLLLNDRNRDQDIGRGCPFTFEYEGDTYEVDGKADISEYGGIPDGLEFEGTITKNGKQSSKLTMEVRVHKGCDGCEFDLSVDFDLEELGITDEEEDDFTSQLYEELEECVVGAYHWATGYE